MVEETTSGEKLICYYCHEGIDVNKQRYGCPVFLARSNVIDYCLARKQAAQIGEATTPETYQLWKYENQIKQAGYLTISSCYHYLHEGCYQQNQRRCHRTVSRSTMRLSTSATSAERCATSLYRNLTRLMEEISNSLYRVLVFRALRACTRRTGRRKL